MIYFWLILLAVVYVVVAVVVGKVCAINSRWEKTVDDLDPNEERHEGGRRGPFASGVHDGSTPLLSVRHASAFPYLGGTRGGRKG